MLPLLRSRALWPLLILLVLLAGCRSPQTLFRFQPAQAASVAVPGQLVPTAAGTAHAAAMITTTTTATAKPVAVRIEKRLLVATVRRLVRPGARFTPLPAAARQPSRFAPAVAAAPADNPPASPLERGALLVGLGSFALAALLKFVLSVAGLAGLIQALFYVSALALALWFGLTLLRATRES